MSYAPYARAFSARLRDVARPSESRRVLDVQVLDGPRVPAIYYIAGWTALELEPRQQSCATATAAPALSVTEPEPPVAAPGPVVADPVFLTSSTAEMVASTTPTLSQGGQNVGSLGPSSEGLKLKFSQGPCKGPVAKTI